MEVKCLLTKYNDVSSIFLETKKKLTTITGITPLFEFQERPTRGRLNFSDLRSLEVYFIEGASIFSAVRL